MFDKDGTLIDFDAFWVHVSRTAVTYLLEQLNQDPALAEELLEAIGIHDGAADVNGVLCKGTYAQMAQIIHDILTRHGCGLSGEEIETLLVDAYNKHVHTGQVNPTCPNLCDVLTALKRQNKKLAVVTTDNREITLFCLERLGIAALFDEIYTDDGSLPTKPNPACALDFCRSAGLAKEHVVMVGDTMTDAVFARNAGIRMVGLAKTEAHKQLFGTEANVIIHSLSDLLEILE